METALRSIPPALRVALLAVLAMAAFAVAMLATRHGGTPHVAAYLYNGARPAYLYNG